MLKAKHLPHEYWAEAVTCTVYILNRCPTKAVMNRIPEEAWSGQKQTVTHMRVFGCVAYAHVPDQLRKKLDNKGEKCVFIGYCDESKAYKLYNPSTKKLIISRDVQFIEDEAWDGSLEKTVNVKTIVSHEEEEEGKISKMTLWHQTAGEFIANQIANQIPIQLFIGAVGIKFQHSPLISTAAYPNIS